MQTQHEPQNVIEETYEQQILRAPTTSDRSASVYGAMGMLVLMLMLLIATGTIPLYHWET
jgi:hypothetical protein